MNDRAAAKLASIAIRSLRGNPVPVPPPRLGREIESGPDALCSSEPEEVRMKVARPWRNVSNVGLD